MVKNSLLTLVLGLGLASGAIAIIGCQEGPAERAGERIDDTTSGVRDKLTPDEQGEKTGKKVDRAIDDAGRKLDDAVN